MLLILDIFLKYQADFCQFIYILTSKIYKQFTSSLMKEKYKFTKNLLTYFINNKRIILRASVFYMKKTDHTKYML